MARLAVPEWFPAGFDAFYGLEVLALSDEEVRARVRVDARHRQPAGLVHGGLIATMAESMASLATHLAVAEEGMAAQGLSNHASFLRPIATGTVTALARRRHRGRSTWVWEVDFTDDQQRLCAIVRMTVAVRPAAGMPGAEAVAGPAGRSGPGPASQVPR